MQNVYLVVITVCINENYPKYVTGLCLLMGALDFILFSSCFFFKVFVFPNGIAISKLVFIYSY